MDILNDISTELQNIDEKSISKQLVTSVLVKLEDYTKTLKKQKKATPFVKISENLSKLFEGFLLDTLESTPAGLDLIRKTIEFQKKLHVGSSEKKEQLAASSEINRKLDLLLSGKEITEKPADIRDQGSVFRKTCPLPSDIDLPIEYDIPVNSEEDSLSYVEFINESTEHIEKIENRILELENNPEDTDLINDIFRPFHSMKDVAGFLGLLDINKLSHEVENLLDLARKGKIKINRKTIDVLLESIDIAKKLLVITTAKIDQKLGKLPQDKKIQSIPIGQTLRKLEQIATQQIPADKKQAKSETDLKLGDILVGKGDITPSQFEEALETQKKKIGEILVEKGAITQQKIEEALKIQQEKGKKISPPLKVDSGKLDILMELVGELVIAQTLVGQDKVLSNEFNQNISKNISNLGKITKTLQEKVMAIRMVPLKQTFMKMQRLVRDVSFKTNKKVDLRLTGVETEVDKTVIDELNDPLIHLLRNSVDHGIEFPAERIKSGKSETGIVHLNAYHQGGNVVIEVTDDGKGLSRDKIYKKALEKKLLDKDKNYTDQEIFNFIMLPGFTTAEVASDISGRGVGLDVVSRNVKKLGGKIEIHSNNGKGSVFTIKLPLTMAIVDGMVVKVGDERYIIPTISILESIHPEKDDITTVKNEGELVSVRGKLYPLIRLHKLFGITPIHKNLWEALIILIESNGKVKGVMVDDLLGQQQVVIKTMDKIFRSIKEISGSAILGDGRVGLILDAEGIISN